jgi:hypothetical protein
MRTRTTTPPAATLPTIPTPDDPAYGSMVTAAMGIAHQALQDARAELDAPAHPRDNAALLAWGRQNRYTAAYWLWLQAHHAHEAARRTSHP